MGDAATARDRVLLSWMVLVGNRCGDGGKGIAIGLVNS